jgi:hypothetical protein
MRLAVGLAVLAVATAGCGETTARPVVSTPGPASTATTPRPAPLLPFHSPYRYGYRFAQRPLVVEQYPGEFMLYFRMNRRLPAAFATVNGAVSGFALARTGFGGDRRPCYAQNMDILHHAHPPPDRVRPGEPVLVKLYIGRHGSPLTVRVALSPVAPGTAEASDPDNLYLRQIGCARDRASAPAPAAAPFHSPHRHGYAFARRPIVVRTDGGGLTLYVRTNRALPKKPGVRTLAYATINGISEGPALGRFTFGEHPKPCYFEKLVPTTIVGRPPPKTGIGDTAVVRLYIKEGAAPLTVKVPIQRAVAPDRSPYRKEATDLVEPYAIALGCPRDRPSQALGYP